MSKQPDAFYSIGLISKDRLYVRGNSPYTNWGMDRIVPDYRNS